VNKISAAEHPSASEIDQLASPIPIKVKEKREFIFFFFSFFPSFLISVYRRKPSAKAGYMLKAASVDVASKSNNGTPSATRYYHFCFVSR
jgi:hypothetical protein